MKKRSRLLCLLLSLVLAFTIGITACGGGGGDDKTTTKKPSANKTSKTSTTTVQTTVSNESQNTQAPAPSQTQSVQSTTSQGGGGGRDEGNGTSLTFWGSGLEAEQQVFQSLVESFNSTIGAQNEIYVEYSPQANVHEAIGNRFNSDTCPDVFYVGDGDYKKYVENGWLLDITDWAENSIVANPYDMWDSIYDRYYYSTENKRAGKDALNGKWYGLPKDIGPTVLYYNETMFRNAEVTVISLAEEDVASFNNDPINFKDDKGNTFNSLGFSSKIPAKGYFVQGDKKVFNNQIAMSWEEVRDLAQVISADASTGSTTVHGYHTEWWFAYGWSVGGDCIEYVDVTGSAEHAGKYLNNGVYDFTLCDNTDNFIVAEGKNFSINGNYYSAGETISYQDKLTNEVALLNLTDKASLAQYDASVLSAVSNGTLVKLPSQREAFLEFVLLSTEKGVTITDSTIGTKNGYEVCPSPTSMGGDGAKTTTFKDQKLGMLVDGRWNVTDFRKNLTFDWDVAPLPIYKAYDEQGNCIARGKEAGHSGSVSLAINAWLGENNPAKAEAAWKFVEYLAGAEGQTQQSLAGFAIPSQKEIAMATDNNGTCTDGTSRGVFLNQKDEQGNLLRPYNAKIFIRAAEAEGEGDWAYLKNGSAWIDAWAGALNSEVRNGKMTFANFLTCDAFVSTYAALKEITSTSSTN